MTPDERANVIYKQSLVSAERFQHLARLQTEDHPSDTLIPIWPGTVLIAQHIRDAEAAAQVEAEDEHQAYLDRLLAIIERLELRLDSLEQNVTGLMERLTTSSHWAKAWKRIAKRWRTRARYYEGHGSTLYEALAGEDALQHRFNDRGTCVRCGEDAEEWDAGCVEEQFRDLLDRAETAEAELVACREKLRKWESIAAVALATRGTDAPPNTGAKLVEMLLDVTDGAQGRNR